MDLSEKNVLIIGLPGSGKTYLIDRLKTDGHIVIKTDDYINYGFEQSLYRVLEDIIKANGKTIVEGVQGYRLLRKGLQQNSYYPDIVIEMVVSVKRIFHVYENERGGKNLKSVESMIKSNQKILQDYFQMENKKRIHK